jgi:hypothetical protein
LFAVDVVFVVWVGSAVEVVVSGGVEVGSTVVRVIAGVGVGVAVAVAVDVVVGIGVGVSVAVVPVPVSVVVEVGSVVVSVDLSIGAVVVLSVDLTAVVVVLTGVAVDVSASVVFVVEVDILSELEATAFAAPLFPQENTASLIRFLPRPSSVIVPLVTGSSNVTVLVLLPSESVIVLIGSSDVKSALTIRFPCLCILEKSMMSCPL